MVPDADRLPLAVEHLQKKFTDGDVDVKAVDDVSFEIREGELYTLLGPSGCGKTSTLRAVAGLERPDQGRISIAGKLVSDGSARNFVAPDKRNTGMVFQSYGIWPHMTVFENAAFPLRVSKAKLSKTQVREQVERALATVQLAGLEDRMATQLSGGQQQRLALARALVRQPKLLLLDEPLSNLDAKLRESMRVELSSLQQGIGITTLYVTHDQGEALSMSSRIAVMSEGRIVQEGSPRDIYQHPATTFVADFVGTTNFIEGTVRRLDGGSVQVETAVGSLAAVSPQPLALDQVVLVAVRPEAIRLHHQEPPESGNVVRGEVDRVMFVGERIDCHVRVGSRTWLTRHDPHVTVEAGEPVWLHLPTDSLSLIPGGGRVDSWLAS